MGGRLKFATLGAALLSMAVAGQALAHTWGTRTSFTTDGFGFADGIVAVNSTTAVAVYVDENFSTSGDYYVSLRRTTNSGTSWGSAMTLTSNGGLEAGVSALAPFVDVAYIDNDTITYRRSIDSGLTYQAPISLSPSGGFYEEPRVARGPNGLVAVAWIDDTDILKYDVRVSTNGGVSFGAVKTYTANMQYANEAISVAVGDGVVYLAYASTDTKIVVRHSANAGASWSAAFTATSSYFGGDYISLTASGTHAYLGYTLKNPNKAGTGRVKYRRTLNSGGSWSSEIALGASTWDTQEPALALQNGILRAVYFRHQSSGFSVYYRQSSNGTSWSSAETVDTNSCCAWVAYAGKVLVLYDRPGSGSATNVVVRVGS